MRQCFLLKKITHFTSIFFIAGTLYAQASHVHLPFVKNIQALPINSKTIELSWSIPEQTTGRTITSFSIYRSLEPIINSDSLSGMQPVSKVNGTYITYRDAVPDDSNYYYAIIINTTEHLDGLEIQEGSLYFDEQYDTMPNDNSTACMIIIPGENATVTSTHVQYVQTNLSQQNAKEKKTREKRIAPVPYTNSFYDNGLLQPENIMSKESNISDQSKEYAITLLTNETYNPDKYLEKYIFSEDFSNPQEEDGHLLFEILRTSFFKEKYTDASEQLTAFLSQNRSETIKQRALFYLGESFYFDGNYKNAIQTFLKIYEVYPNLTRRWIDSSLDFLNN